MRAVARTVVVLLALIAVMPAAASAATCPDGRDGAGWTLSTTTFDNHFTRHAYVGNGYLSQRVPPVGTDYMVGGGGSLNLPTRRPDLTPTDNLARCRAATATSEDPGMYAEAAVDGSEVTVWAPEETATGSASVDLGRRAKVKSIAVHWTAAQPSASSIETSLDGNTWTPASTDASGKLRNPVNALRARDRHAARRGAHGRPRARGDRIAALRAAQASEKHPGTRRGGPETASLVCLSPRLALRRLAPVGRCQLHD
jgi:hypothetical protein